MAVASGRDPLLGEITCGSLLQKLQEIWDEVGESDEKRDKVGESKRVTAVAEDDDNGAAAADTNAKLAGKDEDKRKPLLPQRADLVGFFANANGLSRNSKLHPF